MLVIYPASDSNGDSSKSGKAIKCEREIVHAGAGGFGSLIHATSNQFRSEMYTTKSGKQVERTHKKHTEQRIKSKTKENEIWTHNSDRNGKKRTSRRNGNENDQEILILNHYL